MSRSGYSTDLTNWENIRWRGAVCSSLRGKRGQKFLLEMLAALDAISSKKLIAGDLVDAQGECCALGAVALARNLDLSGSEEIINYPELVGEFFGISRAMAAEIQYINDEDFPWLLYKAQEKPEERWNRVRAWVVSKIKTKEDVIEISDEY